MWKYVATWFPMVVIAIINGIVRQIKDRNHSKAIGFTAKI